MISFKQFGIWLSENNANMTHDQQTLTGNEVLIYSEEKNTEIGLKKIHSSLPPCKTSFVRIDITNSPFKSVWKLQFLHLLFESKCIKISSPTFKFETKISRIASPSKIALSAPVVETVWIYYWSPLTQAPQTFSTKEKPSLDIVFEKICIFSQRCKNKQQTKHQSDFNQK